MSILPGEKSVIKIAALLPSEEAAQEVAREVSHAAHLNPEQARLLFPQELRISPREEVSTRVVPEGEDVAHSLWYVHIALGLLGAFTAVLLWWVWRGHPLLASTPLMSFMVIAGLGLIFGMLAGGLVTLRPDQAQAASELRTGLKSGPWAVVFHPFNSRQAESIQSELQSRQVETLFSL